MVKGVKGRRKQSIEQGHPNAPAPPPVSPAAPTPPAAPAPPDARVPPVQQVGQKQKSQFGDIAEADVMNFLINYYGVEFTVYHGLFVRNKGHRGGKWFEMDFIVVRGDVVFAVGECKTSFMFTVNKGGKQLRNLQTLLALNACEAKTKTGVVIHIPPADESTKYFMITPDIINTMIFSNTTHPTVTKRQLTVLMMDICQTNTDGSGIFKNRQKMVGDITSSFSEETKYNVEFLECGQDNNKKEMAVIYF